MSSNDNPEDFLTSKQLKQRNITDMTVETDVVSDV